VNYEIKLNTRATRQVRKLDPHIKEIVKRRLRVALSSDPYRHSFLSGKYSKLKKVACPLFPFSFKPIVEGKIKR